LECWKLLGLLLDTLELLNLLSRIVGKIDGLETTLLETLKCLEHTLKAKDLLGELLDVHTKLLNIFIYVDSWHLVLI